jgi:hypothetical protein
MSKLTTQPTVITTAAVNPFTRRTFMKTSALTVGAVTLLSKGTALAVEGAGSSSVFIPDVWIYGLYCKSDPTSNQGVFSRPWEPNAFYFDAVRNIKTTSYRKSAAFFQMNAKGPKMNDVAAAFRFSGNVSATVSTDAADETPVVGPNNSTSPPTPAITESDVGDISARATIWLETGRLALLLRDDRSGELVLDENNLPVVVWQPNPAILSQYSNPGLGSADEWKGPLHLSALVSPGVRDGSQKTVRMRGTATVEMGQITGTSGGSAGGNVGVEFNIKLVKVSAGAQGEINSSKSVVEPNASIAMTVALSWDIWLVRRRFNSSDGVWQFVRPALVKEFDATERSVQATDVVP